jgi:hypothetical protein
VVVIMWISSAMSTIRRTIDAAMLGPEAGHRWH